MKDVFDLNRFIEAQTVQYAVALGEISNGKKTSHWIWYIFPQIVDLGTSEISRKFSLKSNEKVKAFFEHPILGKRLLEISKIL